MNVTVDQEHIMFVKDLFCGVFNSPTMLLRKLRKFAAWLTSLWGVSDCLVGPVGAAESLVGAAKAFV